MLVKPRRFGEEKEQNHSSQDEFHEAKNRICSCDHKRNTEIMKKPNMEPITNFILTYRANWKRHLLGVSLSKISISTLSNERRRSYGNILQDVE
jgi:hypothetical protein